MDLQIKEEFNKVNEKIDKVDKRVDKVVEFLQTRVALKSDLQELEKKMVTKIDIKEVLNKLDSVMSSQKKQGEERLVIIHRLEVVEAKAGIS